MLDPNRIVVDERQARRLIERSGDVNAANRARGLSGPAVFRAARDVVQNNAQVRENPPAARQPAVR